MNGDHPLSNSLAASQIYKIWLEKLLNLRPPHPFCLSPWNGMMPCSDMHFNNHFRGKRQWGRVFMNFNYSIQMGKFFFPCMTWLCKNMNIECDCYWWGICEVLTLRHKRNVIDYFHPRPQTPQFHQCEWKPQHNHGLMKSLVC